MLERLLEGCHGRHWDFGSRCQCQAESQPCQHPNGNKSINHRNHTLPGNIGSIGEYFSHASTGKDRCLNPRRKHQIKKIHQTWKELLKKKETK